MFLHVENVGFSINQLITGQHYTDILDLLVLSYHVEWPLNIILTQDVIKGYGQIFQLLLRMENVSITLNNIFMHLKQHRCLFRDFRFIQLQVIRHRMLNYITTIKTFLRNQIVVVEGAQSRIVKMLSGIGQGTVVAALCFLLFINNLPETITNSFLIDQSGIRKT